MTPLETLIADGREFIENFDIDAVSRIRLSEWLDRLEAISSAPPAPPAAPFQSCVSCATDGPHPPNAAVICRECVKDIRADYERQLTAPPAAAEWQPIETCPQKITRALIYWPAFEVGEDLMQTDVPTGDGLVAEGFRVGRNNLGIRSSHGTLRGLGGIRLRRSDSLDADAALACASSRGRFGEHVKYLHMDADVSDDRLYRYWLARRLSMGERAVAFVGVNPSTADATVDDPTIRKCVGFAQRWGFDWLYMLNLCAFRSTDVKALKRVDDPIGPENLGSANCADG